MRPGGNVGEKEFKGRKSEERKIHGLGWGCVVEKIGFASPGGRGEGKELSTC